MKKLVKRPVYMVREQVAHVAIFSCNETYSVLMSSCLSEDGAEWPMTSIYYVSHVVAHVMCGVQGYSCSLDVCLK